jgi:hypothetical protein
LSWGKVRLGAGLGAQEKRVIEQDVFVIAGICLLHIVFGAVVFTSAENSCALNQEFSQPKDMDQGSKIHIWLHLILSFPACWMQY